jgi:energy-coupling factor transporter transmembrane protein EcfT
MTSILISLFVIVLYFLSKLPLEKIFQPLMLLMGMVILIIASALAIFAMGRSTFDSPRMHEGIIVSKSLRYLKNLSVVHELILDHPQQSYKHAKQVLEIEKNIVESNDKKIIEYSVVISFICFIFVIFSIRETNMIEFLKENFHIEKYFKKEDIESLKNVSLTSPLFALIFLIYRFRLISWQAKRLNQIKYCLSLVDEVIKMKGYSESNKKA